MLMPMEFHADTTQLVQMLAKGHHGVQLDAEAWDRLITWIDLNAPYHGTWTEIAGAAARAASGPAAPRAAEAVRRRGRRSGSRRPNPKPRPKIEPIVPEPQRPAAAGCASTCPGWPFDAAEAQRRQQRPSARTNGPSSWATA